MSLKPAPASLRDLPPPPGRGGLPPAPGGYAPAPGGYAPPGPYAGAGPPRTSASLPPRGGGSGVLPGAGTQHQTGLTPSLLRMFHIKFVMQIF